VALPPADRISRERGNAAGPTGNLIRRRPVEFFRYVRLPSLRVPNQFPPPPGHRVFSTSPAAAFFDEVTRLPVAVTDVNFVHLGFS